MLHQTLRDPPGHARATNEDLLEVRNELYFQDLNFAPANWIHPFLRRQLAVHPPRNIVVTRAMGGSLAEATTVGHDSVASDLYGLLPDRLAYEVTIAYDLASRFQCMAPESAKFAAKRVIQTRQR